MGEPFIFTGTYGIREGKLEMAKQALGSLVEHVHAHEPRLQHFGFYFDDESSEVTCVQVHPDSESMQEHLRVISGYLQNAAEFLDFTNLRTHVYGIPSDDLLATLRAMDGDALHVAGPLTRFSRITAS
jgi:hypothetical protein